MSVRSTFPALIMLCSPSIGMACPPPMVQEMVVEQNIGESDAAYFNRLAHMASSSFSVLKFRPALQGATESDDDYQARLEDFEINLAKALEQRRAERKSQEIANAAALWDEAPQILIARVKRVVNNERANRKIMRFTVIDRVKGSETDKSFDFVFPLIPLTSCHPFPPTYPKGKLLVFFAQAGPISQNTVIARYTYDEALDDRTRGWLAAHEAAIEGAY